MFVLGLETEIGLIPWAKPFGAVQRWPTPKFPRLSGLTPIIKPIDSTTPTGYVGKAASDVPAPRASGVPGPALSGHAFQDRNDGNAVKIFVTIFFCPHLLEKGL